MFNGDVKLLLNVGAMRCATTFAWSVLQYNTNIYFPPEKEINFFCYHYKDINILQAVNRLLVASRYFKGACFDPKNLKQISNACTWFHSYLNNPIDYAWYSSLVPDDLGSRYFADFSNTTSFIDEKNFLNIKSMFKDVKVTFIMRNPFNRFLSHLKFELMWNGLLEKVCDMSSDSLKKIITEAFLVEQSDYTRSINNIRNSFGSSSYKFYFSEDIINNPVNFLNSYSSFLEGSGERSIFPAGTEIFNKSPQSNLPKYCVEFAKNVAENVINSLEKIGFNYPPSWLDSLSNL